MSDRPWGPRRQARSERIVKRLVHRPLVRPAQHLLPLRVGDEVSFSGSVEVRVVQGCAEIWGATFRPSPDFVRVVAPPWVAGPRLRACKCERPQDGTCGADEDDDIKQFLADHKWPTVLCLRIVGCGPGAQCAQEELRAAMLAPLERPRLCIHKAWPSLRDRFGELATSTQLETPPVLLVMGPKGVGKSACCRYFVNSLLGKFAETYYLETDLGQPELGPPGLVALHRIRRPLLQVPHAEQNSHECIASFFAGASTPAVHPVLYLQAVRKAFDAYLEVTSNCVGAPPPLVVNSHGWVTGVGLDLVRTILAMVEPQLVIRIQNDAPQFGMWGKKRKLPTDAAEDTPPALPQKKFRRPPLSRCGPLAVAFETAAGVKISSGAPCVLIDIGSAIPSGAPPMRGAPSAPEMRWMRLASYFRKDLDPCKFPDSIRIRDFFSALPCMRLPLRSLRFGLNSGRLEASEVEAAFTGTVVALCQLPDTCEPLEVVDSEAANSDVAVIADVTGEDTRCTALAFVHSFDFSTGSMLIYTASPTPSLGTGAIVLRGDIAWEPHSTKGQRVPQSASNPLQPYCASWVLEGLATGARVLSQRKKTSSGRSTNRTLPEMLLCACVHVAHQVSVQAAMGYERVYLQIRQLDYIVATLVQAGVARYDVHKVVRCCEHTAFDKPRKQRQLLLLKSCLLTATSAR